MTEPKALTAADGSGAMFDRIARRYDRTNRILSMGMDLAWRRRLIDALAPAAAGPILDVATGTADVALALAARYPQAAIVGLDPSRGMLDVGDVKIAAAELTGRVRLVEGDAQALPFEDGHFAGATIAFGIRNVPDRARGLAEMARVVRPGGVVAVLELSEPRGTPWAPFARFHVRHIVPRLGAWLSSAPEYAYLQASIAAFPRPEAFADAMRAAGLQPVRYRVMGVGGAVLYVGDKPAG